MNPLKQLLSLLIALLPGATAVAGDHEVDLVGGVAPVVRTDLLLSPLRYTGALPGFGVRWAATGARASNRVGLDLALGGLRSGPDWTWLSDGETVEAGPTGTTLIDLRYVHGRRVSDGAWTVQLGGTFTTHLEQHYYPYGFTGVSNYLGTLSLSPWIEASVDLGRRQHLELEGWVPLLTWVARSPYAVHDDEYLWHNRDTNPVLIAGRYIGAGELSSPLSYQSGHLRGTWSLDLSDHLAALVTGRLDAMHLTEPAPLAELQLGVHTGLRGSF
jgi:hypothetical protein